jgi:adenylate cyclase
VDNQSRPDRFDDEDLEFLSAFASQAAVAIENAMLNGKLAEEAVARNTLLRFFSPAALPAIMKAGASQLATTEAEATLLFSDISGFTEMSSRMKPTEVIALLNEYFPQMADIVFRNEGTLEKYIGDALLAAWGVPIAHGDDAVRAVRAAIEMQRAAEDLRNRLGPARNIEIHIGVNTGTVAAGNIGSADYVQYATIGDATNVASRICTVAGPGEIVIDAKTAGLVRGAGFALEALGPTSLRGKPTPFELFRVAWR